ncbi:family A polymerase [Citromicrobium phage vB_CbaS-RXM]|nr:family A polymerase [Citromicrobium phage vB_CbaS-RXM]
MRLKPKPTLVFDIETDGLLKQLTVCHCLVIKDVETGVVRRFRKNKVEDTIQKGLDLLQTAERIIGHNILSFDLPALEKLYDWQPEAIIEDTIVHARLRFPDQKEKDFRLFEHGKIDGKLIGTHKLEAWGQRLGLWKADYKDIKEAEALALGYLKGSDEMRLHVWGTWNQEMDDYCVQDVEVTTALWLALQQRETSPEALLVQHLLADLMARQEQSGFMFRTAEAQKLADILNEEKERLQEQLSKEFPGRYVPKKMMDAAPIGRNVNGGEFPDFGITPDDEDNQRWWGYPQMREKDSPNWKLRICPETGRTLSNTPYKAGSWYTAVKWQEFNPRSRQQITNRLQDMGWEPEEEDYTEKGNVKANDVILRRIAEKFPVAWVLADLMAVNKLLGQLADGKNAWLKLVDDDGFLRAYTNPCGAVTTRATHSFPNIAQIPAVRKKKAGVSDLKNADPSYEGIVTPNAWWKNGPVFVTPHALEEAAKKAGVEAVTWRDLPDDASVEVVILGLKGGWGYECRSLFTVPEGWSLVGSDLAGIELRCLAHRMAAYDGGAYGRIILEGDIHSENQQAAGLETRDTAKTFIYAFLYGAGDEKIGKIVAPLASPAKQKKIGKDLKAKFLRNIPALNRVIRDVQKQARRQFIEGLDGRRLFVRAKHAALNTDLQGMGATIANWWLIFIMEFLEEEGLEYGWDKDFTFCAWVHDEVQIACREGLEPLIEEICIDAAAEAGRYLGFKMPVDASASNGKTWAVTH